VGPFLVSLIDPLIANLKQKLIAYGLLAAGALILIFAAGYALDAGHALLMVRYGPVAASLFVAALLLLTAVASTGLALYLNRQPASTRKPPLSSPYSNPPTPAPISSERITAIAAGVGGAVSAATVIASSKRLRSFMAGRGSVAAPPVATLASKATRAPNSTRPPEMRE